MIVYVATNKTNGKQYIGITHRKLEKRAYEHAHAARYGAPHPFARAMRKYGPDMFEWHVLHSCQTQQEALDKEREEIAKRGRRNLYNLTDGGLGQHGRPLSSAARKKIGQANKGNSYRLGKPFTDEVKAKLAEYGTANKHIFEKYRAMGPAASAKRVVCLNDGAHYDSASAAAAAYGIDKSSVIEVCLKKAHRRTAGGRVFRYVGEHYEAEKQIDEAQQTTRKNKHGIGKLYWKTIQCVDDGKIYKNAQEASAFYGIGWRQIQAVCRGNRKTASGRRFTYMEQPHGA